MPRTPISYHSPADAKTLANPHPFTPTPNPQPPTSKRKTLIPEAGSGWNTAVIPEPLSHAEVK